MQIKISKIKKDGDIYPRKHLDNTTIESYTESMKIGADFPPIEVQKLSDDDGEKVIALDGIHRLEAYRQYNNWIEDAKEKLEKNEFGEDKKEKKKKLEEIIEKEKIEEIEVEEYIEERLGKEKHLDKLRIEAIKENLTHGDRLKETDKKRMCRKMAKADEDIEMSEKELATIFNVTRRTINNWTSDIRAKQKGSRNNLIYKLNLLGWTQEEIGEKVGLSQNRVSEIIDNGNFTKIDNEYEDGKSVEGIADYYGFDQQTTWAVILQGKDDIEKFEELNLPLKVYDVWNFSKCCDLIGEEYLGRIPGQLVANLLYYYTRQGDSVVDFMAGGGTTLDACLLLERECFCSDNDPGREEIVKHDLMNEDKEFRALPEIDEMGKNNKVDLVFTDPPYWTMKEKEYPEGSISALPLDKFYDFIEDYAEGCYELLDKGGIFAFLIQNQTGKDLPGDKEPILHTYNTSKIIENVGFGLRRIIGCPQGTQQDQPQEVTNAKEERRMLGIFRDLLIFEK